MEEDTGFVLAPGLCPVKLCPMSDGPPGGGTSAQALSEEIGPGLCLPDFKPQLGRFLLG